MTPSIPRRIFVSLLATVVGVTVFIAVFIAGVYLTIFVGQFVDSGLIGICGPYGKHLDLLTVILLGAILGGLIFAIFMARRFYRHFTRDVAEVVEKKKK